MILIVGTIRIPPGTLDKIRPVMSEMIEASRREDGCLHYAYALDVLDAGLIHVIEKWRDRAALDAHFAAPHLAEWRQQFARFGITDRNLQLYTADAGEPT
ncbi:putative quinol monooxygenase [Erythrobacter donghaensis]|uniref:putative quinol monooxygenase n=1 Tax=Erythrobacter donghaensis TaxID=267135 RepID=UPI000A396030|nr:putative quinol monooxygenase [Erythrobacter donghaensis]